jgi:hypothetical protein
MNVVQRVLHGSVLKITRAACIFALLGLGMMAYSIVNPSAIPVIAAMSVGHVFGISAFLCYLLAVVLDVRGRANSASGAVVRANSDAEPRAPVPPGDQ